MPAFGGFVEQTLDDMLSNYYISIYNPLYWLELSYRVDAG